MAFDKITQSTLDNNGVTTLATQPVMEASALKAKFDEVPKTILAPAHNQLIDDLLDETAAEYLGFSSTSIEADNVKEAIEEVGSSVSTHEGLTNNPHSVTQAQVGLGNVNNTSDMDKPVSTATQTELNKKVDKVDGKGLSTNDYDNTEKGNVASNTSARHTHSNKELLDTYTQSNSDIEDSVTKKHAHSNKALLDTYTQTESDIADSVSKKHEHSNKNVIDKFGESSGQPTYDGNPIGGGTDNYNSLSNKPSINSVELTGNKTLAALGIASASDVTTINAKLSQYEDDGYLPKDGVDSLSNVALTTSISTQKESGFLRGKNICEVLNAYIDGTTKTVISYNATTPIFYGEAGKTYTVSATALNRGLLCKFSTKPTIGSVGEKVLESTTTFTYTCTSSGWYAWYVNNGITTNVQVEEGSSATTYVAPYKSNATLSDELSTLLTRKTLFAYGGAIPSAGSTYTLDNGEKFSKYSWISFLAFYSNGGTNTILATAMIPYQFFNSNAFKVALSWVNTTGDNLRMEITHASDTSINAKQVVGGEAFGLYIYGI